MSKGSGNGNMLEKGEQSLAALKIMKKLLYLISFSSFKILFFFFFLIFPN